MATQWIEAATALDVFGNRMAICQRSHAGIIKTRASLFKRRDKELRDVELPREFWWAEGHEALEQDWNTGDFSTWLERREELLAFGVRFDLDGLLELIPFEERAAVRRRLSVAGSPNWSSAQDARRFAYDVARLPPTSAAGAVIEQCRLGFIAARAVAMRYSRGSDPEDWTFEAREWDIPVWFWDNFTNSNSSFQNWENGCFTGRGTGPQGYGSITLNGVYFLRSSLDVLLPKGSRPDAVGEKYQPPKPNLPEGELKRWWDKRAAVRDSLTQNDLWALAKADFPEHTVSRDRIRALSEGRAPGPKTK